MFVINKGSVDGSEHLMEEFQKLRLKSSKESSDIFKNLHEEGILPKIAHHEWACLCISYHFTKLSPTDVLVFAPDTNGMEIQLDTCFQDAWRFWLAFIANTMLPKNANEEIEITEVSKRICAHWHQGAVLLNNRFNALSVAFPNRHETRQHWLSELAKLARQNSPKNIRSEEEKILTNNSDALQQALKKIGIAVQNLSSPKQGVRYDQYLIEFSSASEAKYFENKISDLSMELSVEEQNILISQCTDGVHPNSFWLKILRSESEWKNLDAEKFQDDLRNTPVGMLLPVCVGTDEFGQAIFEDLTKAPHVFVGGSTGSGKSVCVHAMIRSLVANRSPYQVQIALFDPKRVELSMYRNHSHLWQGQIYIDNIAEGLSQLVNEMENRYTQLEQLNLQNIKDIYEGDRPPFIAVFIEELADLANSDESATKNIERLALKARACGIHLILATQRPDSKAFSGQLRSNIPARIALKVQKSTESTIILGETGAEKLIGKGDRLVNWNNGVQLRHGYNL